MKIQKIRRHQCSEAKGLAVVIDVIKAFTTAAYAFDAGVEKMIVVGPVEEAFEVYRKNPHYELIGESFGLPIEGFHHHNSPTDMQTAHLAGKTLVLRTSSGTQGVVNCSQCTHILAASFVVAEATLQRIKEINPKELTFIITGTQNGEEDLALADYLADRLIQGKVPPEPYLKRVLESPHGVKALAHTSHPSCSKRDLEAAMHINKFDFALEVFKESEQLILKRT